MNEDFATYAQARRQHLFRTAYLLCGELDRAQDLVQTTLVLLLRSWKRAQSADSPEAYDCAGDSRPDLAPDPAPTTPSG